MYTFFYMEAPAGAPGGPNPLAPTSYNTQAFVCPFVDFQISGPIGPLGPQAYLGRWPIHHRKNSISATCLGPMLLEVAYCAVNLPPPINYRNFDFFFLNVKNNFLRVLADCYGGHLSQIKCSLFLLRFWPKRGGVTQLDTHSFSFVQKMRLTIRQQANKQTPSIVRQNQDVQPGLAPLGNNFSIIGHPV